MMRPTLVDRIAPRGWGVAGVLGFQVFVAASQDDEELRSLVDRAVHRINQREPRIKLEALHYREAAVLQANRDVQVQIDDTLGDGAQITIGLLGARLGSGTKGEIEKALHAGAPGPALFVFYPELIVGLESLSADPDQATQRIADHKGIRSFIDEIRASGRAHDELRCCIGYKGAELEHAIWNQLERYTRLWAEEASGRPSGRPAAPGTPSPDPSRPFYRGLKPYRPEDAAYFFGREDDIHRLAGVLSQPQVQALHLKGGSGVGKSSLVLAGLLPRLTGGPELRHAIVFKPGTDPFRSLARALDERRPTTEQVGDDGHAALAQRLESSDEAFCAMVGGALGPAAPDARRIVYIDQLEELLLAGRDGDAGAARRETFARRICALLDADRRAVLVTSIRADRDDLLAEPRWRLLGRRIADGRQEWIYPPDVGEGLAAIVRGPAERAGLEVEPQLITALRADMADLQSWPPLLGAVLEEIALHWDSAPRATRGSILTRDHYRAVGGLASVIGRRTRAVTDALTDEQRALLPQLFALLVRLDDRGRPTKRRFPIARLLPDTPERQLLERLVNGRLLIDEGEVEVVHDLLFDVWPELAAWTARHADDLDELSEIEHQSLRWARHDRPDRELLSHARLDRAEQALKRHEIRVREMPVLKTFVERSRTVSDRAALVAAIESADTETLVRLVDAGVTLDPEALSTLKDRDMLVLHYALFPHRIPRDKAPPASVASGFMQAGAAPSASSLIHYFTADTVAVHGNRNSTVQHFAALAGRVEVLQRLQDLGSDLLARNDRGRTPLYWAVYGGRLETVKWLVSLGAAQADQLRERRDWSLLSLAANRGHLPLVDYLLEQGADVEAVNDHGWTALGLALGGSPPHAVIERLLEAGADARRPQGPNGELPLSLAAQHADLPTLDALIAHGADLGAAERTGWRALGSAIACDSIDIDRIRYLLDRGADPSALDGNGRTPLVLAVMNGHATVVELLLARGVDANRADGGEPPALITAIQRRRPDIVRILVRAPGIDLERPDEHGRSPLQVALAQRAWHIAQDLLDAGAHLSAQDAVTVIETLLSADDAESDPVPARFVGRLLEAGASLAPLMQVDRDDHGQVVDWRWLPADEMRAWFRDRLLQPAAADAWATPPVLAGPWTVLGVDAAADFLAEAVQRRAVHAFPWSGVAIHGVRQRTLAPYPGGRLHEVSVQDRRGRSGYLTLLKTGDTITHFNGASDAIHDLNASGALRLTSASDACDYLRLFCHVVMGDEGAFTILERAEQIHARAAMPAAQLAEVIAVARPPQVESEGRDEQGGAYYVLQASVKYAAAVFDARFRVDSRGMIEMIDDKPRFEDLEADTEIVLDGLRTVVERPPNQERPSQRGSE